MFPDKSGRELRRTLPLTFEVTYMAALTIYTYIILHLTIFVNTLEHCAGNPHRRRGNLRPIRRSEWIASTLPQTYLSETYLSV